jgi:Bacterial protein of unknown function (DUF885)
MDDLPPRVRAVCDLDVAEAREYSGRHEYDGRIQDLSPGGVRDGLARLAAAAASGDRRDDPHDESHLSASERRAQVAYGELELHRSNPLAHLAEMDLACYDRDYAPAEERERAKLQHLALWPEAVEAALASLDRVSAPVASALLSGVRGLAAGIPLTAPPDVAARAISAHSRFVTHVEMAVTEGDPDPALGAAALRSLMSSAEDIDVDLGLLAGRADAERDRLMNRLAEDCARIDASRPPLELCRDLVTVHPGPEGVIDAAQRGTEEAIAFTRERNLVPYHDGVCLVGPAPESRRWAMAMISTNAPGEPEGPSWFYVTPPDPGWPRREQEEWLEVFSDTTLPGIVVHEVAPGHFSHGRALRRVAGPVRRTLHSAAFIEGWAHYAEELCVEEGFRGDDPRFAIGVWLEALVRVTRLACAIGVHTAGMSVEEGARRFEADTHLAGPAALSEARRATFDPTYGRYTWGKLEIMDLREKARKQWGNGFTLLRFHTALMELGSPPIGLIGTALERG